VERNGRKDIVTLLEAYEAPKPDYTKMTRKEIAQSLLRESAEGHLDEVKSITEVIKKEMDCRNRHVFL
jgi:hypothetical protein